MRLNCCRNALAGLVLLAAAAAAAVGPAAQAPAIYGAADPGVKDLRHFDAKRPIAQEMQTDVPDGFTLAAVGDLIISRPLRQYAQRLPAFKATLDVLRGADAAYGNLETSIFAARNFAGAPYSWDGDWTNSSVPAVAKDLRAMGFGIVSRANNHSLDWGPEGMRETSRLLDEAGLIHAGVGTATTFPRGSNCSTSNTVAALNSATTMRWIRKISPRY